MSETNTQFEQLPILQELRVQLQVAFHAREQAGVAGPSARRHRARPAIAAAAGAAVVLVALAAALIAPRGAQQAPAAHHDRTPAPPRVTPPTATMRLAGYTLPLPAGYAPTSSRCLATTPPRAGTPLTVLGAMQAAGSDAGGCIQAILVSASATAPADAQPVNVGPYTAYLTATGTSIVLYVEIPAAHGQRWLVLSANKLSAQQLLHIAATGLPTSVGPTSSCTLDGCG